MDIRVVPEPHRLDALLPQRVNTGNRTRRTADVQQRFHQNHHADRVALGTNRDEREQTNGRLSCKIRFEEEAYYNARGGES